MQFARVTRTNVLHRDRVELRFLRSGASCIGLLFTGVAAVVCREAANVYVDLAFETRVSLLEVRLLYVRLAMTPFEGLFCRWGHAGNGRIVRSVQQLKLMM